LLNTDESGYFSSDSETLRVRVKLYLSKEGPSEEVMPTVQYEGITLIRQNVQIKCESDNKDYVEATSEVSELEGYFCNMKYVKRSSEKAMPRFVKIFVTAFSTAPDSDVALYSEQVAQFEIQLTSSIKVETMFQKGVSLNKSKRT